MIRRRQVWINLLTLMQGQILHPVNIDAKIVPGLQVYLLMD
jgi:hypothetical protein